MGILWSRSGTVEFDNSGEVAAGALAYFYQGNTSTPTPVYQNGAESTVRTQPVTADGNGRWPTTFIPYQASYDVRITTAGGTQLAYIQAIPNPDPVEAGTASVAASEKWATGHVLWRPVGGTLSGFVRLNGRTIGSAASGATERANADTSDLYTHLWNGLADGQAAVSTGRGATAAADFSANKTLTLPDLRGALPIGVDDMGNSAASLFTNQTFIHGSATVAGSLVGANTITIATAQLPSHSHGISVTSQGGSSHAHSGATGGFSADHTHDATAVTSAGSTSILQGGGTPITVLTSVNSTVITSGGSSVNHTHAISADTAHTHSVTGTSSVTGSGSATPVISRAILGTWYMKL